jgi:hypothetical protein
MDRFERDEFALAEERRELVQAGAWLEVRYVAVSQELSIRALVAEAQGTALWVGGTRVQRADVRLVGPAATALWTVLSQHPPTGQDTPEG